MGNSLGHDIQEQIPSTQVALSRVGITKLKRILRLDNQAAENKAKTKHTLFFAEMDLFAHLDARQSGVHMSRFVENIEDIVSAMSGEASPDIETLAERMALAIARTQGAARSEVRIRAQYPMSKRAPVSQTEVEDFYTFIGVAVSDGSRARRAIGVEVSGLTVCPCAREMVSEEGRERLRRAGYTPGQADEIVSLLPLASHNQRGLGTLVLGTETDIRAEEMVRLVESSMSSEIYELLKRPDELRVVTQAHMKPRFVEDVVREIIRNVVENFTALPDDSFVMTRQENFESIHTHNAYAERCGLLGEMRQEIAGGEGASAARVLSLESWLEGLL